MSFLRHWHGSEERHSVWLLILIHILSESLTPPTFISCLQYTVRVIGTTPQGYRSPPSNMLSFTTPAAK